jgi:hypothetical protein
MNHSFPTPHDATMYDEMVTLRCPRCGLKLAFDCKTKRTVPADIFERVPEFVDCDFVVALRVMNT